MHHRPTRRTVLTIVAVVLLASACGGGSATPSGGTPTGPSAAPTATTPSPTAVAATATTGSSQPAAEPPTASLSAEGGDAVVGQLGSYIWLDGGSDSPWLPGTPISVGAGEPLTVTLDSGETVADWSARRVPAGTTDGIGAVALGSGGPPVTFMAPGPGTWSIQVIVAFARDLGSATYYWQLAVR